MLAVTRNVIQALPPKTHKKCCLPKTVRVLIVSRSRNARNIREYWWVNGVVNSVIDRSSCSCHDAGLINISSYCDMPIQGLQIITVLLLTSLWRLGVRVLLHANGQFDQIWSNGYSLSPRITNSIRIIS